MQVYDALTFTGNLYLKFVGCAVLNMWDNLYLNFMGSATRMKFVQFTLCLQFFMKPRLYKPDHLRAIEVISHIVMDEACLCVKKS